MKKQKLLTLLLLISLSLICCKNKMDSNDGEQKLENSFKQSIDDYISDNPLNLPISGNIYKNGFSYPSYHIFFEKLNQDTLMSIVQFPHFSDIKLEGEKISEDETLYDAQKEKGYFLYREKYPLIIFDESSVGGNFYNKGLLSEVPDSLKFNKENRHIKFVRWDYLIQNGKVAQKIKE